MDTCKEHGKKTIFSFLQKKKRQKKRKNQWKKLFSGREFLLDVCQRYHLFYPSNFILFYFSFNDPNDFIYLKKKRRRVPLFSTCSLAAGSKVEKLSSVWLCSSTHTLTLRLCLNFMDLCFFCATTPLTLCFISRSKRSGNGGKRKCHEMKKKKKKPQFCSFFTTLFLKPAHWSTCCWQANLN